MYTPEIRLVGAGEREKKKKKKERHVGRLLHNSSPVSKDGRDHKEGEKMGADILERSHI